MTPSQTSRPGARPIPLLKGALGAAVALAALNLSTGSAHAACASGTPAGTCRVTVNGLQYDVTTFTGDYNSNQAKFSASSPGVMPWYGSGSTTWTFMQAVGANQTDFFANLGISQAGNNILFAYSYDSGSNSVRAKEYADGPSGFSAVGDSNTTYGSNIIYWGQATLYTPPAAAPAPGPLPLFGAGAAFGFSRQLRKRIQGARLQMSSSQPRA